MRFGFAGSFDERARGLAACLLLLAAAGCDRAAQTPESQAPAGPVPAKATPRNVMPPGGPFAQAEGRRDRELTAQVRSALQSVNGVDGADIAVSTVGGKVLLSGALPPEQIARAVQVAQAVRGVTTVENRLAATG